MQSDGLVREMDPDAANREEGRGLAADDAVCASRIHFCKCLISVQSYEKAVAQALYAYIRAGRLDEAIELTKKAQQPWRAASIRGSLVFQWRAICMSLALVLRRKSDERST
jgi:nuclear pore complex protein Nup107